MLRTRGRLIRLALLTLACTAFCLPAWGQDTRGSNVEGAVGDRDNTRIQGSVFDAQGNILPDVQIWAMNHNSPADRMRARTRKTGAYLVRNFGRLYTRDDIYGVTMRLQFEKPGFRTVEVVADVEKNGLTRLFPILFAEGSEPAMDGTCAVLTGKIANAKGKGVKGATVKVTGDGFEAEMAADKGGNYEIVLWNAPAQVTLEVTSPQGSTSMNVDLAPPPRPDVLMPQVANVTL